MKTATIIILVLLIGIGIGRADGVEDDVYIGRALFDLETGKILEYQSGVYYDDGSFVPLGTLKQNRINAGLNTRNVQERYVTQTEYKAYMASLRPLSISIEYEEKLVSATGLDPVTQAAINFAAGGAGAYLVVRRKKPQPP